MRTWIGGAAAAAAALLGVWSLAGCGEEKPAPAPPPQSAAPAPGSAPAPGAAAVNAPAPQAAAEKKAAPATKAGGRGAKLPREAVCAVCSVNTGRQEMEPVQASLTYRGKTYYFCNLD